MISKRLGTLGIVAVLSAGLLAGGCKPPSENVSGDIGGSEGRRIINIPAQMESRGKYKVQEIDSAEYLVARGEVGRSGGTFMDASIGDGPKTFNPWVSKDGTSSKVASFYSAGLVTSDAYTGKAIPYLAKSVTVGDDNMTYTVVLRKGLVWSDGQPLTADDVMFTWNNIIGAGLGNTSMRDNTLVEGRFPEVRKIDDLTIEFKTAKPFKPFIRRLGYDIAPKHVFEPIIKQGGKDAFNAAWGTSTAQSNPERLVGAGMFLVESYNPTAQRIIYKRNPNFHMVDKMGNRLPYLDRYVLSFVNDMNNLQLQFEQGNVDVYQVSGQFVSHVRTLDKPGLSYTLYNLGPADGKTFLFFNLNPRKNPDTGKPLVNPVKSAWFNNQKFRQAVSWAVNRDDIVANILKGVGAPAYTAESPVSPYINKELAKGHPQDLDQARKLLKEAGFQLKDGALHDARGNRVEFELLTNSGNDQRENIGVMLKEDLAQLGIKVNFKPMEFNVLIGRYDTGEWEASIMGLGGGSPLEPHDGFNVWRSDGALHMFNQRKPDAQGRVDISDRYPWEKELDEIFEKAAQTFDEKKRGELYDRYQEIVYEQQPFIYLFSPLQIVAVRDRLQNIDPTPLGGVTHNLEEIWINESAAGAEGGSPL